MELFSLQGLKRTELLLLLQAEARTLGGGEQKGGAWWGTWQGWERRALGGRGVQSKKGFQVSVFMHQGMVCWGKECFILLDATPDCKNVCLFVIVSM